MIEFLMSLNVFLGWMIHLFAQVALVVLAVFGIVHIVEKLKL